ncbi:MAG: type III pantothenate kinase, partial [Sphingomonadales bacterium]|nr:type III pantothenate kinase [Sphingomonadales bacterium]
MLLAIDAGNTNIVFALMEGEEVVHQWRMETSIVSKSDDVIIWLNDHMAACGVDAEMISGAILSSVVPNANSVLTAMVADMTGHTLMIV